MKKKSDRKCRSKNFCCAHEAGFTLIEVIVAMAILSISFVMIMQLFSGGLRASRTSCDYTRAIVHAKDKMEELKLVSVSGSGEFDDGFRWETDVQPYEEDKDVLMNLLKLKVNIIWPDLKMGKRSIELVSLKKVSDENEL